MSSRPEPVEPPVDPVSVERVGDHSWRPLALVTLITAALVVVIAKPWESARSAPVLVGRPIATASAAPPAPSPTIDPVIVAASSRMLCNAPQVWRLISSENTVLGDSRTMYGLDATTATGPEDPAIPTAELHATLMFGVGVCRPNPRGLRVADLPFNAVTLWSDSGPGPPTEIANPYVLSQSLFRLGEAYLGPPRAPTDENSSGVTPTWQAGRYVLEIEGAAKDGAALWLALDFSNPRASTGSLTDQ